MPACATICGRGGASPHTQAGAHPFRHLPPAPHSAGAAARRRRMRRRPADTGRGRGRTAPRSNSGRRHGGWFIAYRRPFLWCLVLRHQEIPQNTQNWVTLETGGTPQETPLPASCSWQALDGQPQTYQEGLPQSPRPHPDLGLQGTQGSGSQSWGGGEPAAPSTPPRDSSLGPGASAKGTVTDGWWPGFSGRCSQAGTSHVTCGRSRILSSGLWGRCYCNHHPHFQTRKKARATQLI